MANLPASRIEAIYIKSTKYATGKPCNRGHVTYRYTHSGTCAGCASEKNKKAYSSGERKESINRTVINKRWNSSEKGRAAKQRWKEKSPKRAWAVYATGGAKMRAALKGLEFDLTSDYVESITPNECPVFGEPFSFIGNRVMKPFSASLDRLDPTKGYVIGNVVVISVKANAIKNAYGSKDIQMVATWLNKKGF